MCNYNGKSCFHTDCKMRKYEYLFFNTKVFSILEIQNRKFIQSLLLEKIVSDYYRYKQMSQTDVFQTHFVCVGNKAKVGLIFFSPHSQICHAINPQLLAVYVIGGQCSFQVYSPAEFIHQKGRINVEYNEDNPTLPKSDKQL